MIEPFLGCMRICESYQAYQIKHCVKEEWPELKLHLIEYKQSCEKYLRIVHIEEEKRSMKRLADIQPLIKIDFSDDFGL